MGVKLLLKNEQYIASQCVMDTVIVRLTVVDKQYTIT